MLKVINLCKQYKNSSIFALDNVSFHTGDTGLIFIIGESGSGKTTLLNILGSLDIGSSGSVYFFDEDIQKYSINEKENYRNNLVGFIFQEHNLFSHLNVRDNILISEAIQSKEQDLKRYKEVIKLLDLQGLDKRYPHEISTGQKQRVAIARALIKNSRLILADEPTGSLDYENATNVMGYLKKISKDTLVIVVSHNKEFAEIYADRIIELGKGKIVSDKVISKNNEIVTTDKSESLLNKNRLPFKTILKYIFSSLKTKIFSTFLLITLISLVITILAVLTFIVKYDNNQFLLKNMEINKDNIVSIGYIYRLDKYTSISPGQKIEQIIELESKFPNYLFCPVFKFNKTLYYKDSNNEEFNHQINGIMEINENILDNLDFELIAGKIPEKNNDYIEVAITKYIYETFKYKQLKLKEGYKYIDSYQNILDKTFEKDNFNYKIVGIIDTKYDFEKAVYSNSIDMIKKREVHNALFTYNGYYDEILLGNKHDVFKVINNRNDFYTIKKDNKNIVIYLIKKIPKENIIFKDGYSYDALNPDDIVITSNQFDELFYARGYIYQQINKEVYEFAQTNYPLIKEEFEKDNENAHYMNYHYYILNNKENKYQPGFNFNYFVEKIISKIFTENDKYEVEIFETKGSISFEKKLNIVGIIYDENNNEDLYVSESLYNELYEFNDGEINYTITIIDFSKDNTKLIKFIYPNLKNFVLYNGIRESTDIVNQMFNDLEKIYNYCWLILIVFTVIIVYYISKSILKNEKQKLGLLFALGVKKIDIMKLLIYEFILILLMSLPLSFILIYILSSTINNYLKTKYVVVANAITYNPFIIILVTIIVIMISVLIYLKSLFKYTRISAISIIKNND